MDHQDNDSIVSISDSDDEYLPTLKKASKRTKTSKAEGENSQGKRSKNAGSGPESLKPKTVRKPRKTADAKSVPKEPKAPKVPKEPKTFPKKAVKKTSEAGSPKTGKRKRGETDSESSEMGGLLSKKSRTQSTPTVSREQHAPEQGFRFPDPNPSRLPAERGTYLEWTDVDYIQQHHRLSRPVAHTVVQLFSADNTVPFIARYRRAVTGGLDADELRLIKQSFDRVKVIQDKANTVIKAIEKANKWTPELHNTIKSLRSLNELDAIHSLYKTTKKSLAERARDLGLGPIAEAVLEGKTLPHLRSLITASKEGLKTEDQVKEAVTCLLADMISKDKRVFDKLTDIRSNMYVQIQTKKTKIDESNKPENKEEKYDMYYDWKSDEKSIKPHHILAINRAESQKIITVKLVVPNFVETSIRQFVLETFSSGVNASPFHGVLIREAIAHAYKKSMEPAMKRRARSEMNEKAEEASMEVFATNVKEKLLSPPVRGKVVLGVDPGYAHGCKLAVVSEQGDVLETGRIDPHRKDGRGRESAGEVLKSMVLKHGCRVIALGNATACRETEVFLAELIASGAFQPLEVMYSIVDEAGASVYSCGDEAKAEFPGMDYNVVSAVSIARRLQDPLAELVKVEPKHLGVGMYQHDLPEKQLAGKLNEVVMEAVSFVGVDVNTASQCLLRRVAGLSETKAFNIIRWRRENGPFLNRQQLMKVKGIGAKSFEQCAGFIRIQPETALTGSAASSKNALNYLDQTWIHPESYSVARALIDDCGLDCRSIGTREFISAVKVYAVMGQLALAKSLKTDVTTVDMIIKGLTMARDEDIRTQKNAPLFRKSLRTIDDLAVGSRLSGEVRNVTHFGAFVDVGVGRDGLIHVSQLKGETLKVGQRVDVTVQNIAKEKNRISLTLIKSY